jgi:predicted enzyme related to lactoylglutathione lyase
VKLKKKLAMVSVSVANPGSSRKFYETIFGIDFAESLTDQAESYHAPIDENGIDLTINPTFPGGQAGVVPYFAVNNIDSAVNEATGAGGKLVWGPADLPISPAERNEYKKQVEKLFPEDAQGAADWNTVGRAALVLDPEGSPVGLVQLAQHAHGKFKAGKHQRDLDTKQEQAHKATVALGKQHRQRVSP